MTITLASYHHVKKQKKLLSFHKPARDRNLIGEETHFRLSYKRHIKIVITYHERANWYPSRLRQTCRRHSVYSLSVPWLPSGRPSVSHPCADFTLFLPCCIPTTAHLPRPLFVIAFCFTPVITSKFFLFF